METLGKVSAPSDVIQNLLDLQQESFPAQSIDWNLVIATLSESRPRNKPECSGKTFRFLVKCSIAKRIGAIGLKQLRDNVAAEIETIRPIDKRAFLSTIQSKLAEYEIEYRKLKEATAILELALWKNKMNDVHIQVGGRRNKKIRLEQSDFREQCRINCGTEIVIQHVLPYVLPQVVDVQFDDDSSESESDSASDSGIESD